MRFFFFFRFKGNESTLFIVLVRNGSDYMFVDRDFLECMTMVEGCIKERLSLIPQTKLLITDTFSRVMKIEEIPPETLLVYLPRRSGLGMMLELLNKRYRSLDLIAMMFELKRTFSTNHEKARYSRMSDEDHFYYLHLCQEEIEVRENLSCLPRLHKMEQV